MARGATALICADINLESAKETASICYNLGRKCNVQSSQVDVRDEKSVQRMVDQAKESCGRIDYFVNTAGVSDVHFVRGVVFDVDLWPGSYLARATYMWRLTAMSSVRGSRSNADQLNASRKVSRSYQCP